MPLTANCFFLDDDGHWVPEDHADHEEEIEEVEESDNDVPPKSGDVPSEGYGAYVSGQGTCMHTIESCSGSARAPWTSGLLFCSHLQTVPHTIEETWAAKGLKCEWLCHSAECARASHPDQTLLYRQLSWCSKFTGPVPRLTGEPD